jgi:DNA-binding transcriptional ArsR family regulator
LKANEIFRALADPTRREILVLLRAGERSAGELAEYFEISKPSMSHHFGVLKAADLIGCRKEGQQMIYYLNTTVMQDVLVVVLDLLGTQESSTAADATQGE